MLTTVSAFAILLFSGVELLKQISVFTMTGLFTVYSMVVLFYPLFKFSGQSGKINFNLTPKFKKIFSVVIILVSVCGIFCLKFNDDIRNLYVPSKKLMKAEKLFAEVTGGNKKTTFALIKGENMQEILQKEENITKNLMPQDYQAISKYIPSIKRQQENFNLRKVLYKKELNKYAKFLSPKEKQKLLNSKQTNKYLEYKDLPEFSEFMPDKNTSLIVLYDIKNPEIITKNGAEYIDVTQSITTKIRNCRINCVKMLLPIFIILFALLTM